MKLLHLYHAGMNLYGEYANVAILARYLTDMGLPVTVDTLSLYEQKDISDYDFYYMGAGTERSQKLALAQLMAYREPLRAACESGKVMLFTGNAMELLGKRITDAQGRRYDALGLAELDSTEAEKRVTGDCLASFAGFDEPLVGFLNKCSVTVGSEPPLLTLRLLSGGTLRQETDGFRKGNCFGTHLTGPLLVKNPPMLRLLAKLIAGDRWRETPVYPEQEKAYEVTKRELCRRIEALK